MDEDEFRWCQQLMNEDGFSYADACAVIRKEKSYEEVLSKKEMLKKADAIQEMQNSEWPLPTVVWDESPERWHLSMDDHDALSFQQKFPDAEIIWTSSSQVLRKLSNYSRRLEDPFSEPYRSKSAQLVAHLQDGGKVSPPMVLLSDGELHVAGGNHRLGWAMHLNQEDLPIIVRGQDRQLIEKLIMQKNCGDGAS